MSQTIPACTWIDRATGVDWGHLSSYGPVEITRAMAAKFPYYHYGYIPIGWVVTCSQYKEYIAPSFLGPIVYNFDNTMAREFDWPWLLEMLLLFGPIRTPTVTPSVAGRWSGTPIAIVREPSIAPICTPWTEIIHHYRDITHVCLTSMDKLQRRHPKPNNFRRLLNMLRRELFATGGPGPSVPADYLWLEMRHVLRIQAMGKFMRTPEIFKDRFFKWIRRQQITDALRKNLGGRPGALKAVQAKKARHQRTKRAMRI